MNLRFFGSLTLVVPASMAILTACGGTADVGNDKSNVNGAGGGNETGGSSGPGAGGAIGGAGPTVGGAAGSGQAGSTQGGAAGSGQAGSTQGGASQGGVAGSGQAGSGAVSCTQNADCTLVDNYCGGCHCLALAAGESAPTCSNPVNCLVAPCKDMTAACVAGTCQASSGTTGTTCGGLHGDQCGADQWCDFGANDFCGAADATGTCRQRPQACDLVYNPVCGCDGKMYPNECAANAAGTDATTDKSCFPQDGGTGGACKTDSDCTLVDNYCGGCQCLSLAPGESAPKCNNPVNCFVEPCLNKTAACVSGSCVSR